MGTSATASCWGRGCMLRSCAGVRMGYWCDLMGWTAWSYREFRNGCNSKLTWRESAAGLNIGRDAQQTMDSLHTYGILAEFAPAYCHYHRNNIDPTSGWGYITRDEKMMINIFRRSGWTNEALKELQERDLIVDMNERAVISSHQKQRRGSRSRSNSALSSRRPSFAEAAPERRPSFNETSPQRRPSFNETSPQRRQSFTQEASPPRRSSRTSSRSSMQSSLFTPDASEDEIKFDPRVMYSTSTSGDEF